MTVVLWRVYTCGEKWRYKKELGLVLASTDLNWCKGRTPIHCDMLARITETEVKPVGIAWRRWGLDNASVTE